MIFDQWQRWVGPPSHRPGLGGVGVWDSSSHHWPPVDYILCSQRWRSSIQSAKTRPGAGCGSHHELLIAKFRLKLKKVGKTTRPFRYDSLTLLSQLCRDPAVGVRNGEEAIPTFIISLNLAIRSSWSEPQPAPGLVFADCMPREKTPTGAAARGNP